MKGLHRWLLDSLNKESIIGRKNSLNYYSQNAIDSESALPQVMAGIPTLISNYMPGKLCGGVTYAFPNTVDVWEWITNFITHILMDVITYPCRYRPFLLPGMEQNLWRRRLHVQGCQWRQACSGWYGTCIDTQIVVYVSWHRYVKSQHKLECWSTNKCQGLLQMFKSNVSIYATLR